MDSKEANDYARADIEWLPIYKEQVHKALTLPYEYLSSFETSWTILTIPAAVIYTAFLPLALTLGAAISTQLSIEGRKPILNQALKVLLSDIADLSRVLSVQKVDKLINDIVAQTPWSESSITLKHQLLLLMQQENNRMKEIEERVTQDFYTIKMEKLKVAITDSKYKNYLQISPAAIYEYLAQPRMQKLIEKEVQVAMQPFTEERCQKQLILIYNYVLDPENSGKNMLRVIKTSFEDFQDIHKTLVVCG